MRKMAVTTGLGTYCLEGTLRLRGRSGRKIVSLDDALEVYLLVSAIAERLGFRVSAAAKADFGAAREAKNLAILILDLKVAFDSDRTIVANHDFRCSH